MSEENPGTDAEGQSVTADPMGIVFIPSGMAEGEAPLPYALTASVGLTPPDVKGRRFATLVMSDGTVTATFRIPWQNAGQFGAGLAQGLGQVQARAQQEQGPSLILPNSPGGLVIPNGRVPR